MAEKVIIAGGGASGLMAAIAAARAGADVTVLEAMERPGRKLLLTGNGRCNLTNMDPELPSRYYGSGKETARILTSRFGPEDTRLFFEELGLLTAEKNGCVYPYHMQASAVLDVLLAELRRQKVKLKLSERIEAAVPASGRWSVRTASWQYTADALVLACGSRCMPKTGSDGSGYRIARQLGHTVIPAVPALVPLVCGEGFPETAAGARCRARVSLCMDGRPVKSEIGELQWTKYGISGIVVFQLSRFFSAGASGGEAPGAHEGRSAKEPCGRRFSGCYSVSIDLLPEFGQERLLAFLKRRAAEIPGESVGTLLGGMLNVRLIPAVLGQAGLSGRGRGLLCSDLGDVGLNAIVAGAKDLRLPVAGTRSFDECQVCAGGVDCGEILPETLESRIHSRLFFAGELLDVDGPCGGYNLQWAWSSGAAAGRAAAGGL